MVWSRACDSKGMRRANPLVAPGHYLSHSITHTHTHIRPDKPELVRGGDKSMRRFKEAHTRSLMPRIKQSLEQNSFRLSTWIQGDTYVIIDF